MFQWQKLYEAVNSSDLVVQLNLLTSLSPLVKLFFTDRSIAVLLLWIIFVIYVSCLSCTFLSVHCSLAVTCWERSKCLALLYVMFSCVCVTFPCGVLGKVWYLIVPIPGICLLTYFGPCIYCIPQRSFRNSGDTPRDIPILYIGLKKRP